MKSHSAVIALVGSFVFVMSLTAATATPGAPTNPQSNAQSLATGEAQLRDIQTRIDTRNSGTINACQNKRTGVLAIKKKCSKKETSVSWNVSGPAGSNGAQGAQGPKGEQGEQGPAGTQLSTYMITFTEADIRQGEDGTSLICNSVNEIAISAGYSLSVDDGSLQVLSSAPNPSPNAYQWNFAFRNSNASFFDSRDPDITFYAYCMR